MLNINQAESHTTNQELYKRTREIPISDTIKSRQLKFIDHCVRIEKNEPAYIYAQCKPEIKSYNRKGKPRLTYRDQIH